MSSRGISRLRTIVQILFALAINGYIVAWFSKPNLYSGSLKGVVLPVLNCYACPSALISCPAGSIQHFMAIKAVPFFVLGVMIFLGALVGRFFCGWVCPFGLLQDILNKIKTRKITIPRWLRFGKYLFLVFTVFLIPYFISDTLFCKLCPQGALEGGIPQMLLNPELHHLARVLYWSKIAILIAMLVAMLFIKRFFCRVICPIGAMMAIFNKVSLLQMKVVRECCDDCSLCRSVCPVDIDPTDDPNSPECIRCGMCTACAKSSVKFTTIFSKEKFENVDGKKNIAAT